jgi:hypothetical protein
LSTTPPGNPPASPTIPLTDDVRAAYQDLYDKFEAEYQSNPDATARLAIEPARDNVQNVLTKDDMYKFDQDTALFKALLDQINVTNDSLKVVQDQIASTASHFATADKILAAISKVLSLVPAL